MVVAARPASPTAERDQLRDLGDRAFWAAEAGLVHLVQQRVCH